MFDVWHRHRHRRSDLDSYCMWRAIVVELGFLPISKLGTVMKWATHETTKRMQAERGEERTEEGRNLRNEPTNERNPSSRDNFNYSNCRRRNKTLISALPSFTFTTGEALPTDASFVFTRSRERKSGFMLLPFIFARDEIS